MNDSQALTLCMKQLKSVVADKKYAVKNNPNRGKCYVASVALLQFLGGKDQGYKLLRAIDAENVPHYWVENSEGRVLDPTADQYSILGILAPYALGKSVGYRGNMKRHMPILDGMKETQMEELKEPNL